MRNNLGDVFLVGLITLIMLTPALFTFAIVWYYHLQYVQQSLPHLSVTPILHSLMLIAMSFFFLFPVWTAYQSYQSAQLKQKVARLERLWQQSI
ncbi:hypothetical protein [Leptolyngbya sp. AN10]|uniref:hypothetical protein n=1 Tax=Leptolyngbya sp. AN10 TaxID=3423365 RepID=UPI003D314DDB